MEKDEIKDLDFFDKKREGFTGSSGLPVRVEMEKLLGSMNGIKRNWKD